MLLACQKQDKQYKSNCKATCVWCTKRGQMAEQDGNRRQGSARGTKGERESGESRGDALGRYGVRYIYFFLSVYIYLSIHQY